MAKGSKKKTKLTLVDDQQDENPVRAPGRRKWFFILGGLSFVLIGGLTGAVITWMGGDTADKLPAETPMSALEALTRGEELQTSGHPDRAMELYQAAMKKADAAPTSLSYRMGVCAEQLRDPAMALNWYQRAIDHPSEEIAAASRLALAKLLFLRGELDSSSHMLAALAAISAKPILASTRIGAEVHYVLALVESARAMQSEPSDPLALDHVFPPTIPFHLDDALRHVPREGNQLQLQHRVDGEMEFGVRVHGPANHPRTTLLSAHVANQPIAVLLDLLIAETKWKVAPSHVAREIASAKRTDVQVRDKTAAELLTLILEPQRLVWRFEDQMLVISTRDEDKTTDQQQSARQRATTLLLASLADSPDHRLAPQAYLALGNLASLESRPEHAATHYRETTERFRRTAAAQKALFNLAKDQYRNGRTELAKEGFYGVVDHRRGSQLEPLAYLYLGRLFFDKGDLTQAKRVLSRSLALATNPDYRATASITLAAAHLVEGGPSASSTANSVLFDHRDAVRGERFRNEVIFLSALTRYRTALRSEDIKNRGRELLAAAMRVDPKHFFGDFGYLLIGDAFADIQLTNDAVELYQAGVRLPLAESMRHRLLFQLATEYRRQHETPKAIELLRELAQSEAPQWAPRAAIELAVLYYQSNAFEACIDHCRTALEQGFGEEENATLLRQLGRVYEEVGNHELAGYCFAGFLPTTSPALEEAQ